MNNDFEKLNKDLISLTAEVTKLIEELQALRTRVEILETNYVDGGVFLEGCSDASKNYIDSVVDLNKPQEGGKK